MYDPVSFIRADCTTKNGKERWMIFIEGRVVCVGIQPTFVSGLAALFAVFYIFNLQYPVMASQTLELIQRHYSWVIEDTSQMLQSSTLTVHPVFLLLFSFSTFTVIVHIYTCKRLIYKVDCSVTLLFMIL